MGQWRLFRFRCMLAFILVSTATALSKEPRRRELIDREQKASQDDLVWVETLSWEPRAFAYHNFLSKEECEHLIALGMPHMVKSSVVDNDTGKSMDSRVRTSSGMFLVRAQDEIVDRIERRIARFSKIPAENGESLQILHYEPSQKYEPHFDYFHDDVNIVNGGQRVATMLMYLSNVVEGGETVFPDSPTKPNVDNPRYSTCGQQGVAIKPAAGDAILFFSQTPDGQLDKLSLHSGCPVIQGNKWSSTKWMRVGEFNLAG